MNDEKKRKYADALEELLKTRSYDKISVNDICNKVGAYRPNFYYHFKNKDDLINWIFMQDYDTREYMDRGEVYRHTVFLSRLQKHASFTSRLSAAILTVSIICLSRASSRNTSASCIPQIRMNWMISAALSWNIWLQAML